MTKFDLNATIRRLLMPNKTLAPWIFDENEKMKEDVRKRLLKIGETYARETIGNISGLEVFDICLTGSSSGYFYHDQSDIDMRLEIHNVSCREISQEKIPLDMFLSALHIGRGLSFKFDNRKVDIKISSSEIDFMSLYSVKNNIWLIKPNLNMVQCLTVQKMTDYYQTRKAEILKEFEEIKSKYQGVELGNALNDFYIRVILKADNIKDYYVFKLLHYEHILQSIGSDSIQAYNNALTF